MNITDMLYDKLKYKYLAPQNAGGGYSPLISVNFPDGFSTGLLVSFTPKIDGQVAIGFANGSVSINNIQVQSGDEIVKAYGSTDYIITVKAFKTYDIYTTSKTVYAETLNISATIYDNTTEYYTVTQYQ